MRRLRGRRARGVAADDFGTVAGGITGQAARLDHGVDHGHALAIGHGARLGGLADDAHLLRRGADEAAHHHRDIGFDHIGPQPRRDVGGELGGRAAGGDDVGTKGSEMRPSGRTGRLVVLNSGAR